MPHTADVVIADLHLKKKSASLMTVMSPVSSQGDEGSEDGLRALCGINTNRVLCALREQDMEEEGRFGQEYELRSGHHPDEDEGADGMELASKHTSSYGRHCRTSPRKRANHKSF